MATNAVTESAPAIASSVAGPAGCAASMPAATARERSNASATPTPIPTESSTLPYAMAPSRFRQKHSVTGAQAINAVPA
jgi:hypothetical protein